jgi:peptidoglycan/LPS O-acetylase OafA/YrhL
MSKRFSFRPDIEGLRALAIGLIVLNHNLVRGFSGGFIGVDVFFVISGFLITSIIVDQIARDQFTIGEFYRRRIVRLFPALLFNLVVVTIVSAFVMMPNELASYGQSLVYASIFCANFFFYGDAGYFTLAATTRPLIHLWSLAVEEQFYIFWPILLIAVAHWKHRNKMFALGILSIVSFLLAVWTVGVNMKAAFYLIPYRAWEFAIGGLLAFVPLVGRVPSLVRQGLGIAGILAILICANRYQELSTPFPGLSALAPCLGTAAVILAGPGSLAGWAFSLAPVRFFGRISYSLYLWHWPVIVLSLLAMLPMHDPRVMMGNIALSILLGWLSYRYVERGGRVLLDHMSRPAVLRSGLATIVTGVAAGALLIVTDGFPGRFRGDALRIAVVLNGDEQKTYRSGTCFIVEPGDRFDPSTCLEHHREKPSILIVGDSVAAHYWPGFSKLTDAFDVMQATIAGCTPQLTEKTKLACQRFFQDVLTQQAPRIQPDLILLAGNWQAEDVTKIDGTLDKLKRLGLKVVLVGPMPRYDTYLPRILFFSSPADREAAAAEHRDPEIWAIDAAMKAAAARHNVAFVSPVELLCPAHRCEIYAASQTPLQFDYVHLTREGSEHLAALMLPTLREAIDPRPRAISHSH